MPVVTVSFNLPEESYEHKQAMLAGYLFSDMHELDEELRGWYKHGFPEGMTLADLTEHVRKRLGETMGLVD